MPSDTNTPFALSLAQKWRWNFDFIRLEYLWTMRKERWKRYKTFFYFKKLINPTTNGWIRYFTAKLDNCPFSFLLPTGILLQHRCQSPHLHFLWHLHRKPLPLLQPLHQQIRKKRNAPDHHSGTHGVKANVFLKFLRYFRMGFVNFFYSFFHITRNLMW